MSWLRWALPCSGGPSGVLPRSKCIALRLLGRSIRSACVVPLTSDGLPTPLASCLRCSIELLWGSVVSLFSGVCSPWVVAHQCGRRSVTTAGPGVFPWVVCVTMAGGPVSVLATPGTRSCQRGMQLQKGSCFGEPSTSCCFFVRGLTPLILWSSLHFPKPCSTFSVYVIAPLPLPPFPLPLPSSSFPPQSCASRDT